MNWFLITVMAIIFWLGLKSCAEAETCASRGGVMVVSLGVHKCLKAEVIE